MRYGVEIEITYLGGQQLSRDACAGWTAALRAEVARASPRVVLVALAVAPGRHGAVSVNAVLRGRHPPDLTNPLDALTRLDTAVDASLLEIGMFEEFDVARKTLWVRALADG